MTFREKYLILGAVGLKVACLNVDRRAMVPISHEKKLLVFILILVGLGKAFLKSSVYYKASIETVCPLKFRVSVVPLGLLARYLIVNNGCSPECSCLSLRDHKLIGKLLAWQNYLLGHSDDSIHVICI